MSFDAIRWALKQSLQPVEKLVLVVIADYHNSKSNRCDPGMDSIAEDAGLSRRGAINIVQRLERRGMIQVKHSKGGSKKTNGYLLMVNGVHGNTVNDVHSSNQITVNLTADNCERGSKNSEHGSQEPVITTNEPVKDRQPSVPSGDKSPACPHEAIVNLYHEILPSCVAVREWGPTRQRYLRKRWREKKERQSIDWWRGFFAYIEKSNFLMGRVNGSNRDPFSLTLEWVVRPTNFIKIVEGFYHRDR
jgi:Helix-turn-helix domain